MKLTILKTRVAPAPARLPNEIPRPGATQRLRGRAAVERRQRWLFDHPRCVECEKQGFATAAQQVDHIVPLWKGGEDNYETNGQSLCQTHHDAKTAREAAERARGG